MGWKTVFCVCALLISQTANAQSGSGSLSGSVLGPNGAAVPDAPIRAVNVATGTDARTYSSATGRYELLNLPGGTYVVSVEMPCCAFAPYRNEGVSLRAAQRAELNIQLAEGGSLNVLGDDPGIIAAELRRRQVIPNLPVPRTEAGRPNLSGVWLVGQDPFPERPEALPWAEALARERIANEFRDHPHTRCLPDGPPVPGSNPPFMGKFVQTPDLLLILFEDPPGFRQVFLDGRAHPADPSPTWMGHSIGRWEGDTLVVDVTAFNEKTWLAGVGTIHSNQLRVIERYTRDAADSIVYDVTIEDPVVFTKPWRQQEILHLRPGERIREYECIENNEDLLRIEKLLQNDSVFRVPR